MTMASLKLQLGAANAARPALPVLVLAAAVLLAGCEETKRALGQTKQAPDEFAVYTRAPLSIPPEYKLRVPEPGLERPQEVNPSQVAQQVLLGSVAKNSIFTATTGIDMLLRDAGALNVDPSIRETVNRETSVLAEEDQTVMEMIMFWGMQTEYGVAVNPELENKRIQENQALGQPLSTGEVPVIERKRKGLLEDIF